MNIKSGRILSKSRYLSGLQCSKKLWTESHARELIPPFDDRTQARFDQGHRVGALALELFPGGLEIGHGVIQWDRVVGDTQRALTQRRPLYEPAFRSGGAACRVDILVPVPGDRWDLLEVKSSTGVKDVHLSDLSLQAHVLAASGLKIRDFYLVHLNSSYVRDGDLDLNALFQRQKVTEEVRERQQGVPAQLAEMQRMLSSLSRPELAIGPHCRDPYACPLESECWAYLPPMNVFDLVRGKKRGFDLLAKGIVELQDIPLTEGLADKQRIQLEAVRSGEPYINAESLRGFLSQLEYPLSYFDIETFGPAIPLFDNSRPYEQIPFLFSIHRVEAPGEEARHYAYMYEGSGDPRADFLRAARASLDSAGSIIAYHASFEEQVLRKSTSAVLPELEPWVESLGPRFVDLLKPFGDFAYHHPDQLGSASLKAVLGPLTGMSYSDLTIADGETASREYSRVSSGDVDPAEKSRVLRELEDYCSLDTLGMVAIVSKLEQLIT